MLVFNGEGTTPPPRNTGFFLGGVLCHRDMSLQARLLNSPISGGGLLYVFHGVIVQIPMGNSDEIQRAEITSSETHRRFFHEVRSESCFQKESLGPWDWLKIFYSVPDCLIV